MLIFIIFIKSRGGCIFFVKHCQNSEVCISFQFCRRNIMGFTNRDISPWWSNCASIELRQWWLTSTLAQLATYIVFIILISGLALDNKILETIKLKLCCLFEPFLSPRLLVSNWSTIEKTTTTTTLFTFYPTEESLSPYSLKGRIQSSPHFPSWLRLFWIVLSDYLINYLLPVSSGDLAYCWNAFPSRMASANQGDQRWVCGFCLSRRLALSSQLLCVLSDLF